MQPPATPACGAGPMSGAPLAGSTPPRPSHSAAADAAGRAPVGSGVWQPRQTAPAPESAAAGAPDSSAGKGAARNSEGRGAAAAAGPWSWTAWQAAQPRPFGSSGTPGA